MDIKSIKTFGQLKQAAYSYKSIKDELRANLSEYISDPVVNITVNAVAPGFIDTDMTKELTEEQKRSLLSTIPLGRLGDPLEIARVVGFLCSEDASYITGETVHVNGGMHMC